MSADSGIRALARTWGPGAIIEGAGELAPFASDNKISGAPPLAVVRPATVEQVVELVHACRAGRVALIPRGAGTGTVGGAVPESPAVVLDTARMDRILEIDPGDRIARVEPGVVTERFQKEVERHGLMYPPDPASADRCTLGGNAATNAGGLRAVKYGVTGEYVMGLVVVTGEGEVLKTGYRTRKGVVGYDLTHLFVGSEGTLGIIVELTLRLVRRPPARRVMTASFRDLAHCARGVRAVLDADAAPCAIELVDAACVEAVEKLGKVVSIQGPYLLIEVDGCADEVERGIVEIDGLLKGLGAAMRTAADDAEAKALWDARRAISDALKDAAPKKMAEDVTVPISKLVALLEGVRDLAGPLGLATVSYGHAGDGNLHVNALYDPAEPGATERVAAFREALFDLTLRLGGTMSGEHGVGIAKRLFIGKELSPASLELHRRIKRALDPDNILNPGKIWPA